jgi:hypothetical protein
MNRCLVACLALGLGGCPAHTEDKPPSAAPVVPACEPLSGVWTVASVSCDGQPWAGAAMLQAPNRVTYDFQSPSSLALVTTIGSCTATVPNGLSYTCPRALVVSPSGPSTCDPPQCVPGGACGMVGSTSIDYDFHRAGDTLTLTSAGGMCQGEHTTVITLTRGAPPYVKSTSAAPKTASETAKVTKQ